MPARPEFIVVGAPKCGTTTIHELFDSSRAVDVVRKEPHFFGQDLEFGSHRISAAEYAELFSASAQVPTGEVSVWYLLSRKAAAEIARWNPAAKIVIMLRNPVDQMYSMHSQALFTRDETEPDFARALALEPARRRGENLPPHPKVPHAVRYREIATYPPQIERFLARFDRSRVHFVVLEDLQSGLAAVWADLLRFLGADDEPVPSDRAHNPNKVHRFRLVSILANDLPRYVTERIDLSGAPRPLKSLLLRTRRGLVDWNRRYQSRSPMDPALRTSLLEEFAPVVAETERQIERPLPLWRS